MPRLTLAQARRVALRASGLDRARPDRVDVRHFRRVLGDLDVVQLDSVNVLTRAHELPFFSRLGGYDRAALQQWLWPTGRRSTERDAFECWAHVASVMPVDAWPLLRHRQLENAHPWKGVQRMAEENPGYVEAVEREVLEHGPKALTDLVDGGRRSDAHYWGWKPGKYALHWLFEAGRIAIHERTASFVARYWGVDDVLPADVLSRPDVPREQATRQLLLRAARANGVGAVEDLADHHRLPIREARAAAADLVRAGDLVEVDVAGWDRPGLALPDLAVPRRRPDARALLVPFDPLVWFRPRLSRLWHFDYTIEIYVPAAKRVHGYYVLPFLLGDAMVARVDLKADRASGRLLVRGAFGEPDAVAHPADREHVARELAAELAEMAGWLGLAEVAVEDLVDGGPAPARGDLAAAVAAAVTRD